MYFNQLPRGSPVGNEGQMKKAGFAEKEKGADSDVKTKADDGASSEAEVLS